MQLASHWANWKPGSIFLFLFREECFNRRERSRWRNFFFLISPPPPHAIQEIFKYLLEFPTSPSEAQRFPKRHRLNKYKFQVHSYKFTNFRHGIRQVAIGKTKLESCASSIRSPIILIHGRTSTIGNSLVERDFTDSTRTLLTSSAKNPSWKQKGKFHLKHGVRVFRNLVLLRFIRKSALRPDDPVGIHVPRIHRRNLTK